MRALVQPAVVAQQVAESFGVIPESVSNYKLQLDGTGSFTGTVKGKITDPVVAGNLVLDSIKARDEQVGRFTAKVEGAKDHMHFLTSPRISQPFW